MATRFRRRLGGVPLAALAAASAILLMPCLIATVICAANIGGGSIWTKLLLVSLTASLVDLITCVWIIAAMLEPAPPRAQAECPRCGYLREGLESIDRCPECGATWTAINGAGGATDSI